MFATIAQKIITMNNIKKVISKSDFEMLTSNLLSDSMDPNDKCLKMTPFGSKSSFFLHILTFNF